MLKEVKGEGVTEVPIMLVGNKKDEDQVHPSCSSSSSFILEKLYYYIPYFHSIILEIRV